MKPRVGEKEIKSIKKIFNTGQLVEGQESRDFEKKISKFSGTKYTALCTSATIGLELALKVLELPKNAEVLIPSFSHPATLLSVLNANLKPVFVDVNLFNYQVDELIFENSITKNTRVLLPVSWGGIPINMKKIVNLAKRNKLFVIEDAACSIGTNFNNIKTGSLADMTVYSFHPRKLIALGDGGAITTNNFVFYKKISSLKHFGQKLVKGKIKFFDKGSNYRMSNILAAVGLTQINYLTNLIKERRKKASYYNSLFKELSWVDLPSIGDKAYANYQSYCIFIKVKGLRDFCLKRLRSIGIECQIGTYAIDRQPVAKNIKKIGKLKNSFSLEKNLLTLPLHFNLEKKHQKNTFNEIIKSYELFKKNK